MIDNRLAKNAKCATMEWHDQVSPSVQAKIIELAQQYVARCPDQTKSWLLLADALRKSGRLDEAVSCLDEASLRFPDDAQLRFCQAMALEESGNVALTLQSLDRTLSIAPEHRQARVMRCRLVIKASPKGGAVQALNGVEAFVGRGLDFFRLQMMAVFHDGNLSEVALQCGREQASYPGDTLLTYLHAVALAVLGRADEARSIITLDRFITTSVLQVPPGFSSLTDFCQILAAEIERSPGFIPDPRGKATRNGLLTWHVRGLESPAVETLLGEIRHKIDDYVLKLGNTAHSFVKARPHKATLTAWAVRTGADGHQRSHHHPSGWLSGVFYVEAPCAMGERPFRGPLLLGALDEDIVSPWGTLEIEPIPGRIVIFPSYLPHATLPSNVAGCRTVVAFDVVPIQAVTQ